MQRLKKWLADSGTTQSVLADAVGVKQPTICEWVNGASFPSMKNLRALSETTGLSVDELLASENPRPQLGTSLNVG